ncbi:hypothetical protein [Kineosporia sp. A_224]|uniref:hypothetical protein n=1 Tax=Kineosporia sp. A_224 TaxID=1962180 RepID=UPI00117A998A|nr:hypothetical protein [Kineosporia sp. A_224]
MTDPVVMPALTLGAVLGDSDTQSMTWSRTIGSLSLETRALSAGVASPLCVNVVFHVDGRLAPNEFQGVRTGRFSMSKSLLVVQAAVQHELTANPRATLVGLLEQAIVEAESYAAKKQIANELPELRDVLDQLSAEQLPPAHT